jgi:hypothetical protein
MLQKSTQRHLSTMTVKLPGSQPCFLSLSSSARLRAYLPTGTLHGSCPLCSTSGQDPTVDHLLSLTAFFPGETSGTSGMSGCLVSLTFLQIPPAVFPHLQSQPCALSPQRLAHGGVPVCIRVSHLCTERQLHKMLPEHSGAALPGGPTKLS